MEFTKIYSTVTLRINIKSLSVVDQLVVPPPNLGNEQDECIIIANILGTESKSDISKLSHKTESQLDLKYRQNSDIFHRSRLS